MDIITSLYQQVESLQEYLLGLDKTGQLTRKLLQPDDKASYQKLLTEVIVATVHEKRPVTQTLTASFEQHSHMSELLTAVVEKLNKRDGPGKHLLTFGFGSMSENAGAQTSLSACVECNYPNQNVGQLLSNSWKILLSRVGDTVIKQLLETRSLFVKLQGDCLLQLSGTPIYDLWPYDPVHKIKVTLNYKKDSVVRSHLLVEDIANDKEQASKEGSISVVSQTPSSADRLTDNGSGHAEGHTRSDTVDHTERMATKSEAVNTSKGTSQCAPSLDNKTLRVRLMNLPVSMISTDGSVSLNENFGFWSNVSGRGGESDLKTQEKTKCEQTEMSVHKRRRIESDKQPDVNCFGDGDLNRSEGAGTSSGRSRGQLDLNKLEESILKLDQDNKLLGNSQLDQSQLSVTSSRKNSKQTVSLQKRKHFCKSNLRKIKQQHLGDKGATRNTIGCLGKPFEPKLCLPRARVLYAANLREQLPGSGLAKLKQGADGVQTIYKDIINCDVRGQVKKPCVHCTGSKDKQNMALLEILSKLIKNHRRTSYHAVLSHHCPGTSTVQESPDQPRLSAPVYYRNQKILVKCEGINPSSTKCKNSSKQLLSKLLEQHVSHRQVYLFLRAVLLKVLPPDLLGSTHNRNVLLKNVSQIISLGRYEKYTLGQLMMNIKVSDCKWLQSVQCPQLRVTVLSKLIYWLMTGLVLNLIKGFFYVTDTTLFRNRLFYYRKTTWTKIKQLAISACMRCETLEQIKEEQVRRWIHSGHCLGVCSMRFLPKTSSLRSIINMGKSTRLHQRQVMSVNRLLQNVQLVLMWIKNDQPELIGNAKFGLDDIYLAWLKFVQDRRTRGDVRPLYFVKADITNCYDTISQQKLYQILTSIMAQTHQDFVIRRYATVHVSQGYLKRTFHRKAVPLMDFLPNFKQFARQEIRKGPHKKAVLVDQVVYHHESASRVLEKLKAFLFHSVIKIGGSYYRQREGIAQGCVLSTVLCNLYYGALERDLWQTEPDELCMRQVDDFLFVTPYLDRARLFLEMMLKGIPEYQCKINQEKTVTSFTHPGIRQISGWFPWCGLLVHTGTLEVQVDYCRYTGLAIQDTVTFDMGSNSGTSLMNKLKSTIRQKCHGMLFDEEINSEAAMCLNAYKLFLLSAYKFHCGARKLPAKQKVIANPGFFFGEILELVAYFKRQTEGKLTKLKKCHHRQSLSLSQEALEWICMKAFLSKLQLHQGGYHSVIKLMKRHQSSLVRRLGSSKQQELDQNTGPAIPPDFSGILG